MKNYKKVGLAIISSMLAVASARAEEVIVDFSGAINSTRPGSTFTVGQVISGSFSFDDAAAASVNASLTYFPATNVEITTPDGMTYSATPSNNAIRVANDCIAGCVPPNSPPIDFYDIVSSIPAFGQNGSFVFHLTDQTATALSAATLESIIQSIESGNLSAFTIRYIQLRFGQSGPWGTCSTGFNGCDLFLQASIDSVSIRNPDAAPTANAGTDQNIRMIGDMITLDGSASFDDNTVSANLGYAWQLTGKPAGSMAMLSNASTSTTSFVADIAGTYAASLVVTDSIGQMSAADEVIISTANLAPTADAGPDRVGLVNDVIMLDGTASSDPEGMTLDFAWSLDVVPAGSNATLANSNSATPNLIPDRSGTYGVSLIVSDNLGPSDPDAAEISVLTRSDFASQKIACAADLIEDLPESAVKTKGNQKALLNYLSAAAKAVQRPDYEKAIERIEFTLKRTDGCFANGVPDGNGVGRDWVEECTAQLEIHRCLTQARSALQP